MAIPSWKRQSMSVGLTFWAAIDIPLKPRNNIATMITNSSGIMVIRSLNALIGLSIRLTMVIVSEKYSRYRNPIKHSINKIRLNMARRKNIRMFKKFKIRENQKTNSKNTRKVINTLHVSALFVPLVSERNHGTIQHNSIII
jgi:hypothetical protein